MSEGAGAKPVCRSPSPALPTPSFSAICRKGEGRRSELQTGVCPAWTGGEAWGEPQGWGAPIHPPAPAQARQTLACSSVLLLPPPFLQKFPKALHFGAFTWSFIWWGLICSAVIHFKSALQLYKFHSMAIECFQGADRTTNITSVFTQCYCHLYTVVLSNHLVFKNLSYIQVYHSI